MEKAYVLIKPLLLIYIFFLPFTHFSSPRDTAFVILFILFTVKIFHKGLSINFKDKTVLAFCLLLGVALITSLIGPYPYESLNFIRKNLLYQGLVFFVIINEYKSFEDLKPLFYTLFASYALLTVLVLIYNKPVVLLNWIEYSDKKYTKGYSLFGVFYIPLALAFIYSIRENLKIKYLLSFFIFLEFVLCVLNNHRGQIVALIISVTVLTLVAKRFRTFVIALVLCLVTGLVLFQAKPDIYDRYKTLLSPSTYYTNAYRGWNGRFAIWSGVTDMITERPLTGYGYGWKKIATVARDGGFLKKWGQESGSYKYFKGMPYGHANPHNLVLQILFEMGILGLGAFLLFWFTIIIKAISGAGKSGATANFLKFSAISVLISYAFVNVANGLWEEVTGVLMILFSAVCVVLYEEIKSRRTLADK